MAELDADFAADDDEVNPFADVKEDNDDNHNGATDNHSDANVESENDDDDAFENKPPKRIKELDDSEDELDEKEKKLQKQFKQNFTQLFANKNNIDENDCVIEEETESKAYYKEHGEQKMEPFNLKQERGEGYFDQFLNYHQTKQEEHDPFLQMMEENEKEYHLSKDVIKKHRKDYHNFETAETNIDLVNEWKSLLPLFSNNSETITMAIQSLSRLINKGNDSVSEPATKKRKLNKRGMVEHHTSAQNTKSKKKKKKRKRAWEVESDDETQNHGNTMDDKLSLSEHELSAYKRKFELFSEKATMLFANGDHNIYEQSRDSLIQRIASVENNNNL